MACLFLRETTTALNVKYKLLQKLDSVQVFFKRMIIITETILNIWIKNSNYNRGPVSNDLVVGGTLNLSSLTTRFWYTDDVRDYKISIIIYHKIFTLLAVFISNSLHYIKVKQ